MVNVVFIVVIPVLSLRSNSSQTNYYMNPPRLCFVLQTRLVLNTPHKGQKSAPVKEMPPLSYKPINKWRLFLGWITYSELKSSTIMIVLEWVYFILDQNLSRANSRSNKFQLLSILFSVMDDFESLRHWARHSFKQTFLDTRWAWTFRVCVSWEDK